MTDMMRQAIRLFDSGSESQRYYDLANCLDGLTFGFGNWPQPEIGEFFRALMADQVAGSAFINRVMEVFNTDPAVWRAFKNRLAIQASTPVESVVRDGVNRLLVQSKLQRARITNTANGCEPIPSQGIAFFQDNKAWFVPIWQRAGRDPAVVVFQVSYWDKGVLQPAVNNAKALGLDSSGVFLLAFYESNKGQAPDLSLIVKAQHPPEKLRAGGREWLWNNPPPHLSVDLDAWHNLLVWQAMCPLPSKDGKFRIRSRNVAYFKQYLASSFRLPVEKRGVLNEHSPDNCDPSQVVLRTK